MQMKTRLHKEQEVTMAKYTIGVDYGTLSGRAVLVNARTGEELASSVYEYPHAVMDTELPDGTPLGYCLLYTSRCV